MESSVGRCCVTGENCGNGEYCSFKAPKSSEGLKRWACPTNKEFCGPDTLVVAEDFRQKLRPYGNYNEFLKDGAGCRYKVEFPGMAGDYD